MVLDVLSALGGVGLFLVGMLLLTDGLKALAGQRMREVLARFTSTPLSGAATGTVTTAIVQSSSATTVAAVGFVASGLLTFPQALGIIFGANVGTTLTGWLVAILGFKLDLGQIALPFVFLGAVLRIAFKGKTALAGQALAGFCLIFIGIEHLKTGLDAFGGLVTPTDFPPDTLFGRLQLVAIGILITLVTQSSSAGVATALAALGAGAISFPQAAALVIGMDVGTTFTAVLATLGGGTMAKRTGFAHVIYNLMTGLMALALLTPFSVVARPLIDGGDPQIALVAFHSVFNLTGVVLILPFARPFARLLEWIVPAKGAPLTRALDPLLLEDPRTATDLVRQTVDGLRDATIGLLRTRLNSAAEPREETEPGALAKAIADTRAYLDRIPVFQKDAAHERQVRALYHSLDHLGRLLYRCSQQDRILELSRDHRLLRLSGLLRRTIEQSNAHDAPPPDPVACEELLDRLRVLMRRQRRRQRDLLIARAAAKTLAAETIWLKLYALRWLHRVSYHLWRLQVYSNVLHSETQAVITVEEETRIDEDQE
ncbi:Na/Pi cotransporter family protein [Labrenzia sp. VG12]|uniref:Na/Pi cotransporter family protein n=1 Tax=Labrenzia sp. VG12 TaxID=2021862 RepID=UPI000B8C3505|nr:Na/Pi symporter [Labrenzia sp. VG12]ASP32391.1 Na/Pi cotransporter [Labrenzia sp. VG12]